MTKTRTIGYWAATGLVGLAFLAGGLADIGGAPDVAETMRHLGYPAYFAVILGFWKVLGALALVSPGLPRVKEWAYAGIVFDLTGAAASHAILGDPAVKVAIPLVLLGLAVASWALRPSSRRLETPATAAPSRRALQRLERDAELAG
jgi:uncharacterized membrane protein YphA (DoxX/SURF4 family)